MEPNNLNEWWGGQPDGLKQAFSLFSRWTVERGGPVFANQYP